MATDSPGPATTAVADAVAVAISDAGNRPGPLLLVLHAVQDALGCLPEEAVAEIARGLNLSQAEVHGVVTFYHDFRAAPAGRHILKICRAESCQAVGADALVSHAKRRLGVAFHETTSDGAITLEPVYCLGNCALSPALLVGREIHGRMTTERFDTLVADLRRQS